MDAKEDGERAAEPGRDDTHTAVRGTAAWTLAAARAAPADELSRVELRLRAVTRDADPRLAEIATHLIDAGGKRLRPMLVVSAAIACGGSAAITDHVIDTAVVIELFHLASLYHDDVLDATSTRRRRSTANAMWGNGTAVLGGDVLLAEAYRVAANMGPNALRRLSQTLLDLCAGQISENDQRFDPTRTVPQYLASIRGKTAALLSTSCWLGATAAGGSPRAAEAP